MYGVQPATLILIVIASFCLYYCNAQTGVCTRQVSRQVSSVGYTRGSYTQQYGCGAFNWRRCRRTLYRSNSRTTYSAAYSSQFGCCAGYTASGGNQCTPVCSPGCENGGRCTAPNRCDCRIGWTGSTCGTDFDECASSSSNNCQQLCSNTRGSYTCSCRSGYRLNSDRRTCAEIHECNEGTDLCDQNCANTPGSYTCSCNSGYTLSTNGRSCLNNDECMLGTDRCTQTCHDTPGSFRCSCRAGYSLNSNGFTCNDINECASSSTNDCQQNCRNTVGSYTCSCNSGYTLDSNGRTCTDINECSTNNGGCEQRCINRVGSYSCSCNAGYSLDSDRRGCSDINECVAGTDNCAQNCRNTVGSFTCSCNTGYTLDSNGYTCNDNNECASSGTNNCQEICNNTPGSFTCSCRPGYALNSDQATCSDIDECTAGTHACAQICTNTIGSYTCSCIAGFTQNGRDCIDIDECAAGTDMCTHNCVNIPGSYNCTCRIGYRLDTDGFTCIDIDECAEDTALCAQDCNNTIGSYTCSCRIGFIIDENGYSCDDIDECGGDHMCEMACNNTAGSFHCACLAGYALNADGRTCGDLDECATGVDECDQTCHNNVGSYTCSCGDGYTLNSDGFRCDDVNECLNGRIGNTTCLEVCVNTPGSWHCGCNPGYTLNTDGISCRDEDECTEGVNQCDQQCSNTIGSYTCSCNSSTTLNPDGFRCDDIDECQMDLDNCAEVCVNTYGTYHCACNVGYTLNADGITCRDANECEDGTHTCEQLCNNTIGSYTCGCNPGYTLTSNLNNCLGSPQDITFDDLESTTATVLWGTPVNDSGDGNILSYTVDCSSETDRDFGLTMTIQASQERRVLLHELRPYMVYNCCVSVRTDTATSPNSCTAQRTLEEAPNNPPQNISIENDDPYSLTFDFAPPLVPNGVLTAYTFYVRFDNGTSIVIVDRTLTGRFVLRNLQPYQLVTIEVSANTSAGEGPKSDVDEIRTAQAAPSMPTGLVVDVLSNSSISIRWNPPAMANGVLRNYTIRVYNVFNNFSTDVSILPTENRLIIIDDLSPFIPYSVNITASTIVGEGEAVNDVIFTEHGVPDVPTLLNVVRISNRSARVFWIPLTLDEARGVLTSLQIAYEPARNGTCTDIDEEDMQLMTITESLHTQSEAVIDGLLSTEEYCVAIQVSTRAGESGFSNVLRGHLPSNTNIQIRLKLSDTSCSSYITENLAQKSTDISSAIVQEILSNCQCPYSLDYVTHSRLLCGSNDREIIYQSNLLNTDGAQATELREMVQIWVNTNPMISVGGVSQQVDSYCQINVKDIGRMECEAMNPTTPTEVDSTKSAVTKDSSVPAIVGGVVGGFLGTVLLVAGIMAVLYAFNRPKSIMSFKKNGEDDQTRLVERDVKMENTVSSETPADYDEVPSYYNPTFTDQASSQKPAEYDTVYTPTYTDMTGNESSLVKPSSEGDYDDILPYNPTPNDA